MYPRNTRENMPMYVVVRRHMHWHTLPGKVWKSMLMRRHSSFGVGGSGFRVHDLNNAHCTYTLGKPVPHAHAHLGAVAFCTCTLGRECPSTVLSAAPLCLGKNRYGCMHLAIHRQIFPHMCLACALSNTWPRQAGGTNAEWMC